MPTLTPTWTGYVSSTEDVVILVEACKNGDISFTPRRPNLRERRQIITSGSIFLFDNYRIKKWTDDQRWDDCTKVGAFKVYTRVQERRHRNAEKPIAKKNKADDYKEDILRKKTTSITFDNTRYHLVSYFKPEDILQKKLNTPSTDSQLAKTSPAALPHHSDRRETSMRHSTLACRLSSTQPTTQQRCKDVTAQVPQQTLSMPVQRLDSVDDDDLTRKNELDTMLQGQYHSPIIPEQTADHGEYINPTFCSSTRNPASSEIEQYRRVPLVKTKPGFDESISCKDDDQSRNTLNIKEQDIWLPIANIAKIMKDALPDNAMTTKGAKECIQQCVSEFISFITSEASEKCQQEKRMIVSGDDILNAMCRLDFEHYSVALSTYIANYRHRPIPGGTHDGN